MVARQADCLEAPTEFFNDICANRSVAASDVDFPE